MKSLLENLRLKQAKDLGYESTLNSCPAISKALITYLEKMFARRMLKPNDPTMQQELVYQAGVDKVIEHLRSQNDRQEKEIRIDRTK